MKGAYPSRAALVSLLTVFVLLSAFFFFLEWGGGCVFSNKPWGVLRIFLTGLQQEKGKKKKKKAQVLERLHEAASLVMR